MRKLTINYVHENYDFSAITVIAINVGKGDKNV